MLTAVKTFAAIASLSISIADAYGTAITSVDWSTPTSGSLGDANISMSGLSSPFLGVRTRSYTGSDFAAAQLPSTDALEYGASNDWTAVSDKQLPDLFLYIDSWRGSYSTNPDPATTYTFSRPFAVLSGLIGAGIGANTLTLPDGDFYSGIIRFAGPLSSLSVDSNGQNVSGQLLTFGTSSVPEPSAVELLLTLGALPFTRARTRHAGNSERCRRGVCES